MALETSFVVDEQIVAAAVAKPRPGALLWGQQAALQRHSTGFGVAAPSA